MTDACHAAPAVLLRQIVEQVEFAHSEGAQRYVSDDLLREAHAALDLAARGVTTDAELATLRTKLAAANEWTQFCHDNHGGAGAFPEPAAGAPDLERFLADMRAELARAEAAWPDGDVYLRLAALVGEVGELAQGTIKKRPMLALRAEAVQVAVTAYRTARVLRTALLAASRGGAGPRYDLTPEEAQRVEQRADEIRAALLEIRDEPPDRSVIVRGGGVSKSPEGP